MVFKVILVQGGFFEEGFHVRSLVSKGNIPDTREGLIICVIVARASASHSKRRGGGGGQAHNALVLISE